MKYVTFGLMTISIGSAKFIIFGMPAISQVEPRLLPCPPSFCAFKLASNLAWYSAVKGACCQAPWVCSDPRGCRRAPLSGYATGLPNPDRACRGPPRAHPQSPMQAVQRVPSILSLSGRTFPACGFSSGLWRFEIAHIRRRLVIVERHQPAVGAQAIFVEPDENRIGGRLAVIFRPARIVHTLIVLADRPRTGKRLVDGRDLIAKNVFVVLVEKQALLDQSLIVFVQRKSARVQRARALEVMRLDFEHIETAVVILIDPFAGRIALVTWRFARRHESPVCMNAACESILKNEKCQSRLDQNLHRRAQVHESWHAIENAGTLVVIAPPARGLVAEARFKNRLILGRKRRLLCRARRLGGVPAGAVGSRIAPLAFKVGKSLGGSGDDRNCGPQQCPQQ